MSDDVCPRVRGVSVDRPLARAPSRAPRSLCCACARVRVSACVLCRLMRCRSLYDEVRVYVRYARVTAEIVVTDSTVYVYGMFRNRLRANS